MPCNGFHPTHQDQLEYKWGGTYGRFNCTACAAGMTGESHTCGALLFTGADIRAASSEAIPDPKSPGLNLAQVDTALYRLSSGRIDLDTYYGLAFATFQTKLIAGAQAILQVQRKVMVDRGYAKGNLFGGGHAMSVGYDADTRTLWFDDPLTGRFPVDWETLKRAAGALVLGASGAICGYGKVYASFSRDITEDWRVSIHPLPGQATRRFGLYTISGRTVTGSRAAYTGGFTGKCTPPRLYTWTGHTSQRLVVVTSGPKNLIGKAVRDDWAEAT